MINPVAESAVPAEEKLIFALDFPDGKQALDMVRCLADAVHFYKIGLQLFAAGDAHRVTARLLDAGKRVFFDLKLFDVPETVGAAVACLKDSGADFVTVHGNDAMLEAAVAEKGDRLKVLAVTALTSLDQKDIDALGFRCDVEQLVLSRARRACELGCDGVVSSGLEIRGLRDTLGDRLTIVVPGIRPIANIDDQKRTIDIAAALENGADHVVIGRPIRLSADPYEAARDFQRKICATETGSMSRSTRQMTA